MTAHTRLYTDARMQRHDMGPGHPERPARLVAIRERLAADPVAGTEWVESVRPAADEAPERLHDPAYVAMIRGLRGRRAPLDADTRVNEHSVEAAYLAIGAAFQALDDVLAGTARNAFVFPRPPGHHAEADRAMGFCLFGTVALTADRAIREHGLSRVLVLDWDVHHGNGTEHLLRARRDVLVCNLHQFPLYPGSGRSVDVGVGEGRGFTANVPLPPASGDAEYRAAFEQVVRPLAEEYAPQLLLVSAGFDAHEQDPLAQQRVTTAGFGEFAAVAREVADRLCGGRLVAVLEGGYELNALADSVHACVRVLAADDGVLPSRPLPPPSLDAQARITATQHALRAAGPWRLA